MLENKRVKSITDDSDATQYLKSAQAGSWVALALVAVVAAFLVAWSMLGTITITSKITTIKQGSKSVAFISAENGVYNGYALGQTVMHEGTEVGVIASCGHIALTPEQVQSAVANDEYFDVLQPSLGPLNLAATIELDPDCAPDGLVELDVMLSQMRPYELLTQ